MSKASREKGKRGEREAAELLRSCGFQARRAQQYHGAAGSADLLSEEIAVHGFHIEVKNTSRASPGAWLDKALADNPSGKPLILWKRPRKGWVMIVMAEDILPWLKQKETENA